jgi:hypothetical protein
MLQHKISPRITKTASPGEFTGKVTKTTVTRTFCRKYRGKSGNKMTIGIDNDYRN